MGAALPGMCQETSKELETSTPGVIHLQEEQKLEGTFQGFHMGQILMKTQDGLDVELPSMALFWNEPQISQASLQVGQPLTVTLPRHQILRVMEEKDGRVTLGGYDGVAKIPQQTVANWQSDVIWAAER